MKKLFVILAAVMISVTVSAQGFGGGNGPGGMPPQGMGQGMGPGGPGGRPGDMKGMPGKPAKQKKAKKSSYVTIPKMYAYALGVLEGDSVVYASDILELDSVQIVKQNGFLVNRQDYSSQFKNYLMQNLGDTQRNRVCSITFRKSRKELMSDFNDIKKLYAKKKWFVQVIDKSQFQFIVTNN